MGAEEVRFWSGGSALAATLKLPETGSAPPPAGPATGVHADGPVGD